MIRWCVENKKMVGLICVLMVFYGIFCYFGLERQENPSIVAPVATIQCIYPGASPEDIEKSIIKPIEQKIGELTEIKILTSYAADSIGFLKVELYDMSDQAIEQTWTKVKDKLDQAKTELPAEAYEPTIDTDAAATYSVVLGLTSPDYTMQDFKTVALELKERLIKIDGVAAVDLEGEIDEEITINLDMIKLNQYQITISQIASAIQARNLNIPGGNLHLADYKIPVQITGEYENSSEIENTIIGVSTDTGLPIYLKHVAEVVRAEQEPEIYALLNNQKALLIGVKYMEKENIVTIGQNLMQEVEAFRTDGLYHNMDLVILTNQSDYVTESTSLFINNLISAIILVVLVVWIAMGARSALVVSLPISLVIAVTLISMQILEIPLHQVSIAALILCLSLLIANGIVANDNMYLQLSQGADRFTASTKGVSQVAIPILTSTLTTIASFLPLAMMQGSAGKFVSSLPILVSIALLTSFFTALTVVPAAGHAWLQIQPKKAAGKRSQISEYLGLEAKKAWFFERYERLLRAALRRPVKIILGFAACLILSLMIVPSLGIQIFPPIEREQYILNVSVPDGFTTAATGKIAEQIGEVLGREDSVANFSCKIGEGYTKYYVTFAPERQGSNIIEFLVNGTRSEAYPIAERISQAIPQALVNVKFLEINMPQEYPVQIRISGHDMDRLRQTAEAVKDRVAVVPGGKNPVLDIGYNSYKLKVQVDEEKANLVGITNYDIASTIRTAIHGTEISTLKQKDIDLDSIPIVMKTPAELMNSREALDTVFITSQITGEHVPLSQIAEIRTESSLNKIVRRNQIRTVTVGLFLEDGVSAQEVTAACEKALAGFDLPAGYTLEFGGETEFTRDTLDGMITPAILALILIYFVLALQFKNLLEPLIIMGTIPLSFIGIILGLRIMSYPIGFMALLGAISLMGVVVNNGIVLLDYIKLLEPSQDLTSAIVAGCQTRIRPIMIGMVTTVISLLPLVISGGTLWAPLATSIVFGMIFSSVLTLILVPCAYLVLHK